jgi:hypothetical protein
MKSNRPVPGWSAIRSNPDGHRADQYPQVLVMYLKRPRVKSYRSMRCVWALQIQRLEGSRPGGLWGLCVDEPVLIVYGHAHVQSPGTFDIFIAPNGKEYHMIQTDPNTVLAGVSRRVSD